MRDVMIEKGGVELLSSGLRLLRKEEVRAAAETPPELPEVRAAAENTRDAAGNMLAILRDSVRVTVTVREKPAGGEG
jgi:hypothetical protein